MASFGENLRRERELRGVGLRDIADATKISTRFLEALEQDRLEVLPGGIFPRAFVRQYARHLGLDVDRTVAEFLYAHGEAAPRPAVPIQPRPRPWAAWVVVATGLTVAGVWIAWPGPAARRAETPSAGLTPVAPPPVPAIDRVYPSPAQASAQVASAPDRSLVLTLKAQQSCWVGVQVDGEMVLNRVLSAGESQTLQAESEIVLSVGNAGGLAFSINNHPGVSLGERGEVRKNIVITHQSLPDLVQDGARTSSQSG
jgi:cytoskeleton protein RodZ